MNNKTFIICLFIFLSISIFPEIRYVSKSGSSTPPYISWETASDSIQKCINISNFGDTIYVGNGVYKEKVVMIDGLALIGSGSDSCIIDHSNITSFVYAVELKDSCIFENFRIMLNSSVSGNGVGIHMSSADSIKGCKIKNNSILNAYHGIAITEGIIKNNFIVKSDRGINCSVFDESQPYVAYIDSNFINFSNIGIQVLKGTIINVNNNIFKIEGEFDTEGRIITNALSGSSTPNFSNNVILKPKYDLIFERGIVNSYPGSYTNNLFIAKFKDVFRTVPVTIKNNIIIGSQNAVYNNVGDVKYNNFWKVSTYPNDTTNISFDPMFVNDSTDFHLQMYSPLIDAGDSDILDPDGSRSDIGLYGGPFGQSYKYEDLPPRIPQNFTAKRDSNLIYFRWNQNTESDFKGYRLYRDTTSGFNIDTTKIIASVKDTFYIDVVPEGAGALYYKITSFDKQGNESEPGEQIAVVITDVGDYKIITNDYYLYQNYPNPFNSSTIISYKLKSRSYVKIYLYDLTGSVVSVIENMEKQHGYHQTEFSAEDLSSGIYLYKIDITDSERKIPVFTEIKKMILMK